MLVSLFGYRRSLGLAARTLLGSAQPAITHDFFHGCEAADVAHLQRPGQGDHAAYAGNARQPLHTPPPAGHPFPVPESAAVASPSELPPSIGSVVITPASMAASPSSAFVATRQSTS